MTDREGDAARAIADVLRTRYPDMENDAVADVLLSALEQCSIDTEGPGEVKLLGWLRALERGIGERRRSI